MRTHKPPPPDDLTAATPPGPTRDEAAWLRIHTAMNRARRHLNSGRHKRDRLVMDTATPAEARQGRKPGGWFRIGHFTDMPNRRRLLIWWQPTTERVQVECQPGIRCDCPTGDEAHGPHPGTMTTPQDTTGVVVRGASLAGV